MNKYFKTYVFFTVLTIAFFLLFTAKITLCETTPPRAKGPLATNNIYPFYVPFINLLPEDGKTLGTGNIRLTIANNYANTFNWDREGLDDGFLLDMDLESYRLSADFDIGVTQNIDIGIEGSYVVHYGGVFDPVIEAFHNIFGFSNGGRENVEHNKFSLNISNLDGTWVDIQNPVSGVGDITFKAKLQLIRSEQNNLYVALQPAVKIPIGDSDSLISNGKVDLAVNLLIEKQLSSWALYANVGWMHLGQPENLTTFNFNPDVISYMVALEWIISNEWSLFIQADGSASPYESGHKRLDKQSGTINLGFRACLSQSTMLQVSFSEEFLTFAATDVALTAALVFNI